MRPKVLELSVMAGCNPCYTRTENRLKLSKKYGGETMDVTLYQSMIANLRYLVNSRPDIAHAVGICIRYMEAPGAKHWAAIKQILR